MVIYEYACGEISNSERDRGEGRGLYSSSAEGRQRSLYRGKLIHMVKLIFSILQDFMFECLHEFTTNSPNLLLDSPVRISLYLLFIVQGFIFNETPNDNLPRSIHVKVHTKLVRIFLPDLRYISFRQSRVSSISNITRAKKSQPCCMELDIKNPPNDRG